MEKKTNMTQKTFNPSTNKTMSSTETHSAIQSKPRRRSMAGATFAIVALSLLLAGSVVLGVTGAFFTSNQTVTGTITLGDPVTISITQGGSAVETLTFTGNALPGTIYDQSISVTSPASTSDAVLRAKLTLANTDTSSANVVATTATGWTINTDDYYYYDGTLTAGNTIDFVTQIEVPTSLTNLDANKTYAISVVVEAIQYANGAAAIVWTTAPTAWVTEFGSGA